MLGIFSAQMPLIYGKGWNAFIRLPLEGTIDPVLAFQLGILLRNPREMDGRGCKHPRLAPLSTSYLLPTNNALVVVLCEDVELEVFVDVPMKTRRDWPIPLNIVVQGEGRICIQIGSTGTNAWCRADPKGFVYADRLFLNTDFPNDHKKRFTIYMRQNGKTPISTKPQYKRRLMGLSAVSRERPAPHDEVREIDPSMLRQSKVELDWRISRELNSRLYFHRAKCRLRYRAMAHPTSNCAYKDWVPVVAILQYACGRALSPH